MRPERSTYSWSEREITFAGRSFAVDPDALDWEAITAVAARIPPADPLAVAAGCAAILPLLIGQIESDIIAEFVVQRATSIEAVVEVVLGFLERHYERWTKLESPPEGAPYRWTETSVTLGGREYPFDPDVLDWRIIALQFQNADPNDPRSLGRAAAFMLPHFVGEGNEFDVLEHIVPAGTELINIAIGILQIHETRWRPYYPR